MSLEVKHPPKRVPNKQPLQQRWKSIPVNLADTEPFVCPECQKDIFVQVTRLKILPEAVSPSGREEWIPVDYFMCRACNHVTDIMRRER